MQRHMDEGPGTLEMAGAAMDVRERGLDVYALSIRVRITTCNHHYMYLSRFTGTEPSGSRLGKL